MRDYEKRVKDWERAVENKKKKGEKVSREEEKSTTCRQRGEQAMVGKR